MAVRARAKKGSPPKRRKPSAEPPEDTAAPEDPAAGAPPAAPHRIYHFKRYHTPGTAPGTLRAHEEKRADQVRVTVIHYDPSGVEEREIETPEECDPYSERPGVTWINVEGLTNVAMLESLGRTFGLHPLALEDVLNCGQRPKIEDYGDYQFVIMRSLRLEDDAAGGRADQPLLRRQLRAHLPGGAGRLVRGGARAHPPRQGADPQAPAPTTSPMP